jgi:ABC-2 type transport system permease protein
MIRIIDIALKDLTQLVCERETFLFLLFMPLVFTLLFGLAFGGFAGEADPRLPVGYLDEDHSSISRRLGDLLSTSLVIRLEGRQAFDRAGLETLVANKKLAAAVIIPKGYGRCLLHGKRAKLVFIGDNASTAGTSIQSEVLTSAMRLESAVRTALVFEKVAAERVPFDYILDESLARWEKPPISVNETTSSTIQKADNRTASLAHTSPGMMLQFAIAGLMTAAQMLVAERKSHALQRLLTTAARREHILLGHFAAILTLILFQFTALISFGQFILKVNYLRVPSATLLVALSAALCIASLGLLISTLAKSEEQAIMFSLIPMFVLAALGGAWVPLEVTGPTFQTIGHLTPLAWAMDGFKNISIRGLGIESVLLPCAVLSAYAALFFALAMWKFMTE